MATAALQHQALLVKYGLSQSVLDQFVQSLDQLDEAVALGIEGRFAWAKIWTEVPGRPKIPNTFPQ